jgi:predicted amidohydrolase
MKIALAQINPVIGDFEYNYECIRSRAEAARRRG